MLTKPDLGDKILTLLLDGPLTGLELRDAVGGEPVFVTLRELHALKRIVSKPNTFNGPLERLPIVETTFALPGVRL